MLFGIFFKKEVFLKFLFDGREISSTVSVYLDVGAYRDQQFVLNRPYVGFMQGSLYFSVSLKQINTLTSPRQLYGSHRMDLVVSHQQAKRLSLIVVFL